MRFWSLLLAIVLCKNALFAQNTSSNGSTQASAATYKTVARQVIVDVVVTGQGGVAITGLKQPDFKILEDGKPQQISFFEEHTGVAPPTSNSTLPPLPPNIYTNYPVTQMTDSVNVLLLDALNTPMKDQSYVRQQMIKYLKSIPPGTRIAIFTLASRLRMVQGFTSDSSVLLAALDSKNHKALPQQSSLLDTTSSNQDLLTTSLLANATTANSLAVSAMQQFDADTQTFMTDLRVRITLEAFSQLARYLAAIPGRKNLVWFSATFPLTIDPNLDLMNPFEAMANYGDQVHEATESLRLAQVAVYPVDARGLMGSPVYDASVRSGQYNFYNPLAANSSQKAETQFFEQTQAEHATMNTIARETGGEAIYDTNGLKEALERVINNGTRYYTLAYSPSNSKLDGAYRHVKIQVARSGSQLAYRRGYFADDASSPNHHSVTNAVRADPFLLLMGHGLPSFTQIIYKVQVVPAESQPEMDDPIAGDIKTVKGPVTRYNVSYAVALQSVGFSSTADGLRHADLRFAAVAYDSDGKALNSSTQDAQLQLKPETYATLMRSGLQCRQQIDVPNGQAFLRTGVYDPSTGSVGTLEIPLSTPAPKWVSLQPSGVKK
jgi:VWFA-related protein